MISKLKGLVGAASLIYWVWVSLATQIIIVVTGGLVRLTGSGLGCPTWPNCTEDSLVTVPEQGIHGVIEFANRLLTFVLVLVALGTFLAVRRLAKPERIGLHWPALTLGLGIVAQAVVGGVTVKMKLNSWIVGVHFVISAVMILVAAVLVWNFYRPKLEAVPKLVGDLSLPVSVLGGIAVILGVLVTGAGPHAGDAETPRNGFDLETWQHFHSYPAYLLFVVVLIQFSKLLPGDRRKPFGQWRIQTRVTALLLLNLALQAVVGIAQSRLGVPPVLVAIHMALASTAIVALTWQSLALRRK